LFLGNFFDHGFFPEWYGNFRTGNPVIRPSKNKEEVPEISLKRQWVI
jgi:hypothetical protein